VLSVLLRFTDSDYPFGIFLLGLVVSSTMQGTNCQIPFYLLQSKHHAIGQHNNHSFSTHVDYLVLVINKDEILLIIVIVMNTLYAWS
jgi:hypothetical protein